VSQSRVIVAGTRDADRQQARVLLRRGFEHQGLTVGDIDAIASGESGVVDALGKLYAEYHGVHYQPFPADWDKHGKAAGPIRNAEMAKWCAELGGGTLVAVWDGVSRGTADMILQAHRHGLTVEVQMLDGSKS
jgi:hypothetical protein